MAILNYTTKVSPEKTVSEIQGRLVKNGARQVSFAYDDGGNLSGLNFQMFLEGVPVLFSLTPNVDGVLAAMKKDNVQRGFLTFEHATRVAWRIEKDWLEAQLAKIEAGLASPIQLLLPYAVTADGSTFYQKIQEGKGQKLLK